MRIQGCGHFGRCVIALLLAGWCGGAAWGQYDGGAGTAESPFEIATAGQLYALACDPCDWGKHFVLTADIDLSDYDGQEGRPTFGSIGRYVMVDALVEQPFEGVFDGAGHTVSGLYFYDDGTNPMFSYGLFGFVGWGGRVEAVVVHGLSVWASSMEVGGLVGRNLGTVNGCRVEGASVRGMDAGGLVGFNAGKIIDCLCGDSSIHGSVYGGGMSGYSSGGLIEGCRFEDGSVGGDTVGGLLGGGRGVVARSCATGGIQGFLDMGGLVGLMSEGGLLECYARVHMSLGAGPDNVGALVGREAFQGGVYRGCVWDLDVAGTWPAVGSAQQVPRGVYGKTALELESEGTFTSLGWDFVGETSNGWSDDWVMPVGGGSPVLSWELGIEGSLPSFSGGSGACDDPYVIAGAADLNKIGHHRGLLGKCFVLAGDIDLAGGELEVIGESVPFVGTFEGNGYAIRNWHAMRDTVYWGVFGRIGEGGVVSDLRVSDVDVASRFVWGGCLVGWNVGHVLRCGAEGGMSIDSASVDSVGGLAGVNCFGWDAMGVISESFARVDIIHHAGVDNGIVTGGFAGENYGLVEDSACQCELYTLDGYASGFVCMQTEELRRCYSVTDVTRSGAEWVDFDEEPWWDDDGNVVEGCFWWSDTDDNVTLEAMQMRSTFESAGWDFLGESVNGDADVWRMCVDGVASPRLWWESGVGDVVCPDGVDVGDLAVVAEAWLFEGTTRGDIWPGRGDGVVNLKDFAALAGNWMVLE